MHFENLDEYISKGRYYFFQADFDSALYYTDLGQSLAIDGNDMLTFHRLRNLEGYIHAIKGNYDSAFMIHIEVLQVAEKNDLDSLWAETMFYLGNTKLALSNLEDAEGYFSESLKYLKELESPDPFYICSALNGLAQVNMMLGNVSVAGELLSEARSLLESAGSYPGLLATNYWISSDLLITQGQYNPALRQLLTADALIQQSGEELIIPAVYCSIAEINGKLNKKDKADEYFRIALQKSQENQQLQWKLKVYDAMFDYYYDLRDFEETTEVLLNISNLKKQLALDQKRLTISNIENDVERKFESLRAEMLESQLAREKRSNQIQKLWIFLAVLILTYFLGFVIVFRRITRQKNETRNVLESKNAEIRDRNELIEETQNRLIRSEKMAILGRLSAGIAHELNNPFGAIKSNVELIHHIQYRELEKWAEIADLIDKETFNSLLNLTRIALTTQENTLSTKEERKLKRRIGKFFEEVAIENKDEVIEIFTDLKVVDDLNRFTLIYSHDRNIDLLDLALYVVNRSQSTNTAMIALSKAEKILSSFRMYSYKRGWANMQTLNVSESINTMLLLQRNQLKGIEVIKKEKGDLHVNGIPDELSQVWSNLLSNASFAMKKSGTLEINMTGSTDEVVVEFEDTGGGIHVADKENVFEPFFTTKSETEGNGLGLDISRYIILKHNGKIDWENTSKGAKFTVTLPKHIDEGSLNAGLDEQ